MLLEENFSAAQSLHPEIQAGREGLVAWERSKPSNFFECDAALRHALEFYWGEEYYSERQEELSRFGGLAATQINDAVIRSNRDENLPRLERFSPHGERVEEVVYHPSYHEAGRLIYGSGIMGLHSEPGNEVERMALLYISLQNGEAGHNCPLACTAGLIKALSHLGSDELKFRYMGPLLDPNYDRLIHGAQYLTEVQGGSDVGANGCRAEPVEDTPGLWRVYGEKWFCSNVTAELALMTARPVGAQTGTGGLGLFLLPRHLEGGRPNHMTIRRLKTKLGTRSMASGELDFNGALAWQLGSVEQGFRNMIELVIATSRLYNILGCAGLARRAYVEARTYAEHRRAFGGPILRFPLVRQALARMRAYSLGMLASGLDLARLEDLSDIGVAAPEEGLFRRLMLNLMKTMTSRMSTRLIHEAIGILGGNGAIEDFSVLPRLLRDSIVFENWEGTHHVLTSQILRDLGKFDLGGVFMRRLGVMIEMLESELSGGIKEMLAQQTEQTAGEIQNLLRAHPDHAPIAAQAVFDRMGFVYQAACLAREGQYSAAVKDDPTKLRACEFIILERLTGRPGETSPQTFDLMNQLAENL